MILKPNERAAFRTFEGKIITGKVISITNNCYLVVGDYETCKTYGDGLYRFTDRNVVKE